jgi:hypothetical protein
MFKALYFEILLHFKIKKKPSTKVTKTNIKTSSQSSTILNSNNSNDNLNSNNIQNTKSKENLKKSYSNENKNSIWSLAKPQHLLNKDLQKLPALKGNINTIT